MRLAGPVPESFNIRHGASKLVVPPIVDSASNNRWTFTGAAAINRLGIIMEQTPTTNLLAILICVVFVPLATAQDPTIVSFEKNGELVWTNGHSNAFYTVEWAASLTGIWRTSWWNLRYMPATGSVMKVKVPMFYRLRMLAVDSPLEAKTAVAESEVRDLQYAVEEYGRVVGRYPSTEEGLAALRISRGPGQIPDGAQLDPWQRPYWYRSPGAEGRPFDIWSVGQDGQDGTGDDVTSWKL